MGVQRRDDGTEDSLSHAAVTAIADYFDVDPVDLDPPLFAVVDPDALDALFQAPPGQADPTGGRVAFEYQGVDVVVYSDGRVTVDGTPVDPVSESG